ncbi:MAG: endolytic transglycosylase MltG [Lachnospiraceae bacterium]|jgi:cell division protein YceG involved in septum cleavage
MSETTKDINKVTGAIIGISFRLIIYAVAILLIYEGATKGYEFGHEIFYASSMEEAPGRDMEMTLEAGTSVASVGKKLEKDGLIHNRYSFIIQAMVYEYEIQPGTYTLNTSMTSREILEELSTVEESEEEQ